MSTQLCRTRASVVGRDDDLLRLWTQTTYATGWRQPTVLSITINGINSIQQALLAWETYVYIAKASEIDNKQK